MGDQQATGPKGSVAILIDDVQWADRKSVEALTFIHSSGDLELAQARQKMA